LAPRMHLHEAGIAEASWSFRDSAPTWRPAIDGEAHYAGAVTLDPFPAYAHRRADIATAIAHVTACWAPLWDVHLFSVDREEVGRCNGFSTLLWLGRGETIAERRPTGQICLVGKRIPIHPAMTRYLVAHEYGHNVEWMLEAARGDEPHTGRLMADYAELRGLDTAHHGAGGTWHDSPHEIFACDFRILICQTESEHWPHPGIARPETVPGLADWWFAQLSATLPAAVA
jgi:hypothetical protein